MEKESRRKRVKKFLKRKKKHIVVLSMVLLTVLTLIGLAYATLTGTLNITGTGNIRNSKWKVKFDNLSQVTLNGTAEEATAPHIDTNNYTRIVDYSVVLNQPGDYVTYTFDVVNEGDYDAKIGDIVVSTPSCHGIGDDALTDAANVCDNLTYTVTYADGTPLALNQVLQSKQTAHLKFKLMYNSDTPSAELPKDDVEVTNLSIKITYVQNDRARVNDDGTTPYVPVYSVGDRIQVEGDESGDYYRVIAASGTNQDYVVALKEEPLTVSEVNTYGTGHVNRYAAYSQGKASDRNGYGGMAYYSSSTCGWGNGSQVISGCTTSYDASEVKYVVDNWSQARFTQNQLKTVNDYAARLITREEYDGISSSESWRYNSSYYYWTMSQFEGSPYNVWSVYNNSSFSNYYVYGNTVTVRPVINVYKSKIDS